MRHCSAQLVHVDRLADDEHRLSTLQPFGRLVSRITLLINAGGSTCFNVELCALR